MKKDERQKLLGLSVAELRTKISELAREMLVARQEKRLQDKSQVDVKKPYKLRKQIKMIKAELTARELRGEGVQE